MNLVSLSIKRPIFIICVFFLVIGTGWIAMKNLPVDLFPDVTFPVIIVSTPYPGTGPKEIETLVSKVIEDELSSLNGIKTLRSVNREGLSMVIAEFNLKTDIKYSEQQVRERVSSVRRRLPDDVEQSSIRRIDPSDQAVITIGIKANLSPPDLYDLANEEIKPKLQQVDQVGQVDILGGRKREIQVLLDQNKLSEYQISASTVVDRIKAAGENIPAGKINERTNELVYRTLAEFRTLNDIEATVVSFFANENPVRVKDLGVVQDSLEEESSRVFVNGDRSLVFHVYRQSGANTIAVVDAVKQKIDEINDAFKGDPRELRLSMLRDNARIINFNVTDVKDSIFIGMALTIIVVLYFLGNFRSTLITGMALPNSLLGAFILMMFFGFTINTMSLLALSLSVGLLIDDAIVVRENIYRHIEMGKDAVKASLEGAKEVTLAVVATTLTVVAVFAPLGFLSSVPGQFLKQFGLTVCFIMLISLFDSLTMAPMMSAYFAGNINHTGKHGRLNLFRRSLAMFDRFQNVLVAGYEKVLVWVLKFPKTVLVGALGIFILSVILLKFVPKTFLPAQDAGEFNIKLELPQGTTIDEMEVTALKVDSLVRSFKQVARVQTVVGSKDRESNLASLAVILVPSDKRKQNTSEFKEIIRNELKAFKEAKPRVTDVDNVGMGSRPFTLNISGSDLDQLVPFVQKVYDKLSKHPALKDPEFGYKPGKPEFQFIIDPPRAEMLGVSTTTAGRELRTLVEGMVPAVFRKGGYEYDIRVRSQENQRNLKLRKDQVYVPNINQKLVRISAISDTEEKIGPATIHRENRNRYIGINADIAPKGPGMGGLVDDINKMFKEEFKLPRGMSYRFFGQAQSFQDLQKNITTAMGLGILFIYLVLAALYESFIIPFTIMLVLPLALCGAFIALLLTQSSLDLFSMIGCIMLLGVATKNSILLVDYANQQLAKGKDRITAIREAGRTRLRPILMTSFALISGTLPVAIGLNEASKQRTSMGIAIIGGLISSTLLTLLVVPAAYSYVDRFDCWVKAKFRKATGTTDA